MTTQSPDATEQVDRLPDAMGDATGWQIERANAAVEANLNDDGSRKYDSAQGYACALTAIMAEDARHAALPSNAATNASLVEALEPFAIWLRRSGDYVIVLALLNDGREVELIREHGEGNYSHIIEPSGIAKAVKGSR